MAIVGRKKPRISRPAVILRASVIPASSRPMRTSTLLRCQRVGRNRQIQASSMRHDQARQQEPAGEARHVRGVLADAERRRWSRCRRRRAARRCGRRSRPVATLTRTGLTAAAAALRARSQSPWSNDEFGHDQRGDQLGREHRAPPRRGRRPSGRPAASGSGRRPCRATRRAGSSRGPWRPGSGPRPSEAASIFDRAPPSRHRTGRGRPSPAATCAPRASAPPRTRCRPGRPARRTPSPARRRWRSPCRCCTCTAAGRPRRPRPVPARSTPRCRTRPAGARRCRTRAMSAGSYLTVSSGRMSAPRMAVITRMRIPAATPRRVASLRVKRAMTGARWISIGRLHAAQCGLRSWAARSAWARRLATRPLTCLPSARPRILGRQPAHDLAHVPRARGAGRGDGLVEECRDLGLAQRGGQVLVEDVDLRLLLGGEVVPPGLGVGIDRLAARLHLARQHGQELVVGEGLLVALLDVVGGVGRHAQDVAAQRITAAHRSGDVGLDSISKGHRAWLPRAVVR